MIEEEFVRASRRKVLDDLAREEMEQGLYDRTESDEQIRQLQEDVTQTEDRFANEHDRLRLEMEPWWFEDDPGEPYVPTEGDFVAQGFCIIYWVRRIYSTQRILARLKAALAELEWGMRTAAPDGARSDAND